MSPSCPGRTAPWIAGLGAFFGIRNANDVATCLAGYGQTTFPRGTDWTFTRFYLQQAVDAGYRLVDDAQILWDAFVKIHNKAGLAGTLEIPMESFKILGSRSQKIFCHADLRKEAARQTVIFGHS